MNANTNDAASWYRLGNAREDEGRDAEALACFERAVEIEPGHARAWNNLGAASQRLGDHARAEDAYRRALAADPALLQPHLNLGRLHEGRGEFARAAACYRDALAHHPGDAVLEHLLAAAAGVNTERAPRRYVESLFDEQAPRFDAHLVGDLEYRIPGMLAELAHEALSAQEAPVRILDLGCGTGLVGAALAGASGLARLEISGADLSAGMLAQAQRRGVYAQLVQADALEALRQRPPDSLAAVFAADVFIYIGELRAIFSATARALARGGVFAFSVETLEQGDYRLQPTGRYAHALDHVRALAAGAGLDVVRMAPARIRRQAQGYAQGSVALLRRA